MDRTGTLALCALVAAWAIPLQARAQSAAPAAAPASEGKPVKAKKHVAVRRQKVDTVGQRAPAASSGYDLVPSSTTSAQARARQNSFSTPDDDSTPSRDPRHIGIGLGGSNGTTPGVQMGF